MSITRLAALVFACGLLAAGAALASACGGGAGTDASPPDGALDDDAATAIAVDAGADEVHADVGDASDASVADARLDARDADMGFLCASNSGANVECNCAVGFVPVPGPIVPSCPEVPVPYLCVAFDDQEGPDATFHECECRVKCGMQTSDGGASICACGAASFVQFGGAGTTQTAVAGCALTLCCKGEDACDCSDDPAFTCRPAQTAVASCKPADYDEALALSAAFPAGAYQNVTVVTGCK